MKEGLSPSKPPSLPRTFPKSTRPYMAKICFAMFGRVLLGKVLCFWGGIFIWCGFAPVLCVGRIWRISFAWISYPTALPPPIGRDSRTLQKIRTSHPSPKTSPQDPHHQKGETKLRSSHGGGLVGKFGEVEGGLEGEGTPSERGFLLPPRSFHPPTSSKTAPERNGRGGRGARGERK